MTRTALITAGTTGLGFAVAEKLLSDGFDIAITGHNPGNIAMAVERLEAVAAGHRVFGIVSDLTDPRDTEGLFVEALAALKWIDCLVVNSGHMAYGTVEDLADDQWYQAIEMLLMSAVRLSRHALPHMRERGRGDIVFITAAGAREPSAHLVLSSALRAAIANMAKTLSQSAARDNIRVNVVAPGYFDTGRVSARVDALASERGISRTEAMRLVAGDIPLGRAGAAQEIGELVGFICSRKAEFLNGTTIVIDGGRSSSII
ncbi:SDR family oxidoreductase (plasmid) [Microvirga sp. RSM25]|uniref:SDR family oxidoreductase n=1 Tax=Microvirga sp. RSM25 TaxID=3273802 RepID=UPI00384BCB9D